MTPRATLVGARIGRVDMPSKLLLCLALRIDRKNEYLICGLGRQAWGLGLVNERPRGEPATSFVRKLRNEIGGAKLLAVTIQGNRARYDLRVAHGTRTLIVEGTGRFGNVTLVDDAGQAIAALRPSDASTDAEKRASVAMDAEALRAAGPALMARLGHQELERQRVVLRRALGRIAARLRRRLGAIQSDAMRIDGAAALRDEASLVLANLHRFEPGQTSLLVSDWTTDPPSERTLEVDPRLGPRAHADRLFHRARRLERGAAMAAIRHTVTVSELASVDELRERCERASTKDELDEVTRLAGERGLRLPATRPGSSVREERLPYRKFRCGAGTVLVGRGADDNDALTLRHARPSDLWMHARDHKGAHVVVPLGKSRDFPAELLVGGALLAVHFSDARGEDRVEVQYTRRRYVRKPKGAAPGAVLVTRDKVLLVRSDPERLRQLLANEG